MTPLATAVTEYASKMPEGVPLTAKDLLHLGSRAAVDQALSRLARRGSLLRVGRGLYVRPVEGRFGARPPEAASVVQALATQRAEGVVPHGAAAANELGLTTQVPVQEVYLTSGPSRKLYIGKQVIALRHAPAWQLVLPNHKGGALIRALAWLGPARASETIAALQGKLSQAERGAVAEVRRLLPTWMAAQVSKLVNHG